MNKTCGDQPCKGCPWRRKSLPGWLGSASPERFALAVLSDAPLPCHNTINYENEDWEERWVSGEEGQLCAGAAVMMANIVKLPRDPERRTLEPDEEMVFGRFYEFIEHHRSCPKPSWSEEEDRKGREAWEKYGKATWAASLILAEMDED